MKTSKFQRAEWNTNSTTRKVHWRDFIRKSHHRFFYPDSQERAILLPSSSASLFRAAYAFRITWSGRVCEFVFPPFVSATSLKCIDREGPGRHVQGLGKSYITHRECITIKPHTIPVDQRTQTLEIEWDLHYLLSRDRTQVPKADAWRYWDDHVRMRTSAL